MRIVWCPGWGSNPHATRAQEPKSCLSANSNTWARSAKLNFVGRLFSVSDGSCSRRRFVVRFRPFWFAAGRDVSGYIHVPAPPGGRAVHLCSCKDVSGYIHVPAPPGGRAVHLCSCKDVSGYIHVPAPPGGRAVHLCSCKNGPYESVPAPTNCTEITYCLIPRPGSHELRSRSRLPNCYFWYGSDGLRKPRDP